jgi:hypothetical protein
LKDCESVVGFETMNEPHPGYIGLENINHWNELKDLHLGDAPNAIQGFLLGQGIPQTVNVYARSWPWPTRKIKTRVVNEAKQSAWLPGRECIWYLIKRLTTGNKTVYIL